MERIPVKNQPLRVGWLCPDLFVKGNSAGPQESIDAVRVAHVSVHEVFRAMGRRPARS